MKQESQLVFNFSNSLLQRLKICWHILVYKKAFIPVVINFFIPSHQNQEVARKAYTKPYSVN